VTSLPNTLPDPGPHERPAATKRPRRATASKKRRAPAAGAAAAAPPLSSTDKIVEAASHLFARKGYANSTLDEVSALAGFTKGAVYYYFKNKESLLLELLKRIEQRSIDATIKAIEAHDGSATSRLQTFVRHQTRWAGRYPEDLAVMVLMSIETAQTPSKVRAQMLRIYRKLSATLEAIIEAGKASKEFSTDQDTRDTVLYLQAVHDGNMMIWFRSGTDPEIGRRLTQVTMAGFLHAVTRGG
jgi:AcrR family transcriptional regulator